MTFTLRQLQFLIALADAGSFRKAAEICHVTQPTMSAAIKELEAALCTILAERTSGGAVLTPAGERTVAQARQIVAQADELTHTARHGPHPLTGALRLGLIPTVAPYVLPQLLSSLSARHPTLTLSVHEDITDRLSADLRGGALDAAVIALPCAHDGIEIIGAFDDEFLLAAPDAHELASGSALRLADLAEHELLLLGDGHCLRDHVLTACAQPGRPSAFAATSLTTLMQMVAHGLGVTLAPDIAVRAGALRSNGVTLRRFDPPLIGRQIGVAWRAGSARAGDAKALAHILAEIMTHAS